MPPHDFRSCRVRTASQPLKAYCRVRTAHQPLKTTKQDLSLIPCVNILTTVKPSSTHLNTKVEVQSNLGYTEGNRLAYSQRLNSLMRNAGHCLLIRLSFFCFCALSLLAPSGTYAGDPESWNTVESENFLVFHRGNTKSAQKIIDIAEDFYPKMHRLMGDIRVDKIEIWVCQAPSEFQAAVHAPIQDWAIGCAFPLSRRIIIQNPRVIIQRDFQLAQVIRHEIVHIVFGQRTRNAIGKIPRWFVEGVAIYFSGEWAPRRNDTLMKHIFSKSVIPLGELTHRFPRSENLAQLAYAESQNAVAWLAETHGIEKLWEIIDQLASGGDLDTAFRDSIGLSLSAFDAKWRNSLPQRYHWAAMFSSSYLFWGSLALFFILVYLRYWRYKRKRLRQLEQESEEVDAFFIER